MSVKVNIKKFLILALYDAFFCIIDFRMFNLTRLFPLTIKIVSSYRSSVISIDNSVRVEHWNDFYDELISQFFSIWMCRHQEIYHGLARKRPNSLSRMHSSSYKENFLVQILWICNRNHLHEVVFFKIFVPPIVLVIVFLLILSECLIYTPSKNL